MPNNTLTLDGVVLAVSERPYDFVDRKTGERVTGTTRTLWLGVSFDEDPQAVKFRDEDVAAVARLKRGDTVSAHCDVFANNNQLSYRLARLEQKPKAS